MRKDILECDKRRSSPSLILVEKHILHEFGPGTLVLRTTGPKTHRNGKSDPWIAPDVHPVEPNRSSRSHIHQAPILARQSSDSGNTCPSTISGGGIAGIVIGSIAGTLLLIWLWKVCTLKGAWSGGEPDVGYVPGAGTSSRGRRRRRRTSSPSVVEYVEKGSRSRPRYEPRRPARVYMT